MRVCSKHALLKLLPKQVNLSCIVLSRRDPQVIRQVHELSKSLSKLPIDDIELKPPAHSDSHESLDA